MKSFKYKGVYRRVIRYSLGILIIILLVVMIYKFSQVKDENNKKRTSEVIREKKDKDSDVVVLIEIDKKHLYLIDKKSEDIISTYTIATGREESPTPLGSFQIIKKAYWGEGFGSRWLGLNVPWGTYGIHGTNKPGSIGLDVSAGCVRMRNSDIEELYDTVNLNTNVIIQKGDYGSFGTGFRTLKPGDRGSDVFEVQKRLNQLGFYLDEIDGIYGELMKESLIEFLKYKDLPLTDKIDENLYKELRIILMD